MQVGSGHKADSPDVIYIIRHGEKPESLKFGPQGYDLYHQVSIDGLTDAGWRRAWGLAQLFAGPRPLRAGIATPDGLFAPSYGDGGAIDCGAHRSSQTIRLLALKIRQPITCEHEVGKEDKAIADVLNSGRGVKLMAWEHHHIPDLAAGITLAPGTVLPQVWPDDRFDVIWRFEASRRADGSVEFYRFSQLPQLLLKTDQNRVIAPDLGGNGLAA